MFTHDLKAEMKYRRFGHSVCMYKNIFLFVTGTKYKSDSRTVEAYSIEANRWIELPLMPLARYHHASCVF